MTPESDRLVSVTREAHGTWTRALVVVLLTGLPSGGPLLPGGLAAAPSPASVSGVATTPVRKASGGAASPGRTGDGMGTRAAGRAADAGWAVGDSTELLERARDAQRRFESLRVRHLPVTLGWGGSECDDEVGRMCWRHDTGGSWTPEPGPPEVEDAREELLATLEEVAREIPGDSWVLGQRVWYLGEAGRWEEAVELARRCGPPARWWCDALEGLGLHRLGRYEEAGSRFERALAEMDPERAARWRDPARLLDGAGRDALDRARETGGAESFQRRLWAYADPLWIVPGNDRLTEHLARRTVAVIRSEARNPHGISWGGDLEELLVRYGWEVGWERISPSPVSTLERRAVVGHEHPESRTFVPPGRVLAEPLGEPAAAWVPVLAYAPAAYAPLHAPILLPAPSVLSVVPLGDSVAVVGTYALPRDTTRRTREGLRPDGAPEPDARRVEAGLLLRDLDGRPGPAARVEGRSEGALMVVTEPGAYVVSMEVWDPGAGLAGRHRVAVAAPAVPPDVASLSDLLLLREGPEPGTLEEAVPRLLPDVRLPAGGAVRIAWVVAGLGFRDEVLSYRLSLRDAERGILRRAGEWLGLLDRDEPQRLIWEEPGPRSPGPVLRSVTMTLPDVAPGEYVLRLELATRGRGTVVSERRVEVVGAGAGGG